MQVLANPPQHHAWPAIGQPHNHEWFAIEENSILFVRNQYLFFGRNQLLRFLVLVIVQFIVLQISPLSKGVA
jgi:hypothetical protein